MWDFENWRPILLALVLPPVPWLLLGLVFSWGAYRAATRLGGGVALVLVLASAVLVWLSSTQAVGRWAETALINPPQALPPVTLQRLQGRTDGAIVVLGGGREPARPETEQADLRPDALARLRYGIWLSRQTGWPIAYTGGVGRNQQQQQATTEAAIAERVAREEFGVTLRWVEGQSRDTRENARFTTTLLQADDIREVMLVTHAYHQPRAFRAFDQVMAPQDIQVVPAPMGHFMPMDNTVIDWLPTAEGYRQVRLAVREWIALLLRW